jgi:streptogramin lyase
VATVVAGHRPTSIALVQGRVWVGERRRPAVRAFEPASLHLKRTVRLPTGISQLVAARGALWVTLWRAKAVARLDPRTGQLASRPIPLPGTPSTLAVGGGSIYVGLTAAPTTGLAPILKLDQKTGALLWTKQLRRQADRIVWLNGSLWAMVSTPNRLFRIDQGGVTREGYDLPGSDADDLTVSDGRLWATVRQPDNLVRVDLRTKRVADTFVGRSPTGVAVHGNDVWVGLWSSNRVVRRDARSLERRGAPVTVAINPFMLTADKTGAWVVCAGDGKLTRVKKL